MKKKSIFTVNSNQSLNSRNNLLKVSPQDGTNMENMKPGQFVQLLVEKSPYTFLRRPISINFYDKENNEMWLLIQKVGEGTKELCSLQPNDSLDIIYPLGNTFSINEEDKDKELLLIGGGVGIAPMLYLGKTLKEKGFKPTFLLGGRTDTDIVERDEFEKYGALFCTTEDGSFGEKGYVTNHSVLNNVQFSRIYTCGPKPMMQAVAQYASKTGIACEVSLENMMACGFGACLCCVEKNRSGHNVTTCVEGPIFNIEELTWID